MYATTVNIRSPWRLGTLAAVLATLLATGARAADLCGAAPVRDADYRFSKHVRSWKQLKEQNIVMQRLDYSCGAAALATVIRYYWGDPATEDQFLRVLGGLLTPDEARDRIENGLTLTDLRRAAVAAGYQASIGTLKPENLTESKVPLIVGITVDGHDHFAVFRGTACGWVFLADPIRGNVRIPAPLFEHQWQKNAVLVVAKPNEKPREVSPLSVRLEEITLGSTNWQHVRTVPSRSVTQGVLQRIGAVR